MFLWVWWNAFWHSVGDSLLSSFFIVWSHNSSYSPQGPSHNALGHISDVCNNRWAANTQQTLHNVPYFPQWISFSVHFFWCSILIRFSVIQSGITGICTILVSHFPSNTLKNKGSKSERCHWRSIFLGSPNNSC